MSRASRLSKPYRVENGKKFRLRDFDPADTSGVPSPKVGQELLQKGITAMADLQDKLYAQNRWGVLLIFQAMDAAGKDGTIKHVMSGLNPASCQVYSFKAPSSEELDHDYLWRTMVRVPQRGRIGIFNRSYYEELLVVRVHRELLQNERMPTALVTKGIWKERFEDINAYERYLTRNGIVIRKFFLNISRKEQKRRFLARLDEPEKNWKFSDADVREREFWNDYMAAYEEMIGNTATEDAPWYVVPADNKWYTRVIVSAAIVDTLQNLDLSYPKVSPEKQKQLQGARRFLSKKSA